VPSDSLKRRNVLFLFVLGTTTLAEAAAAAPDYDRKKFVELVESLGARDARVQDLLDVGKLWTGLKEDVSQDLVKKRTLEAFFDFCNRGMRHVAVAPKGKRDFFFVVFLCLTKICSSFDS
jgi:hypothetical protein